MKWLRIDIVLAIHKQQIAEHGGADGVRDIGLLDSALARPQNLASYKPETDIASLAAAYGFAIARNHPFVDGNKRTALAATRTFLYINKYGLNATQQEKFDTFLSLAEGSLAEDELNAWIRSRLIR